MKTSRGEAGGDLGVTSCGESGNRATPNEDEGEGGGKVEIGGAFRRWEGKRSIFGEGDKGGGGGNDDREAEVLPAGSGERGCAEGAPPLMMVWKREELGEGLSGTSTLAPATPPRLFARGRELGVC